MAFLLTYKINYIEMIFDSGLKEAQGYQLTIRELAEVFSLDFDDVRARSHMPPQCGFYECLGALCTKVGVGGEGRKAESCHCRDSLQELFR